MAGSWPLIVGGGDREVAGVSMIFYTYKGHLAHRLRCRFSNRTSVSVYFSYLSAAVRAASR